MPHHLLHDRKTPNYEVEGLSLANAIGRIDKPNVGRKIDALPAHQ